MKTANAHTDETAANDPDNEFLRRLLVSEGRKKVSDSAGQSDPRAALARIDERTKSLVTDVQTIRSEMNSSYARSFEVESLRSQLERLQIESATKADVKRLQAESATKAELHPVRLVAFGLVTVAMSAFIGGVILAGARALSGAAP